MLAMDMTLALRARSACSWLAAGILVCSIGCSGAERRSRIPLTAGEVAEVTYVDDSNRLVLRSAAAVDDATYQKHGLYGNAASPDVKLADQDTMQVLVDALDELGHFARGAATTRPGAKVALLVKVGDRQTVWSQPTLHPDNMGELERFNAARMAFLQIHNNIISYHASKASAADFDRALAEQNAKNKEAVQNILQKARGQGR